MTTTKDLLDAFKAHAEASERLRDVVTARLLDVERQGQEDVLAIIEKRYGKFVADGLRGEVLAVAEPDCWPVCSGYGCECGEKR